MRNDSDTQNKVNTESHKSSTSSASLSPEMDQEHTKAMAEAINNMLKSIPFIGPFIIVVKLKWGWTGILLLISGFFLALILVFTGLLPERVISDKYKTNSQNSIGDYEIKLESPAIM